MPEVTSGENAATVRRALEAYNATGDVDRVLDMAHPDVEWGVAPEHPAATTHRGHAAVRGYLEDWQSALDDMRVEIQSISESGDTLIAVCRIRGEGTESGAAVEVDIAFLDTFRDGKAIRIEEFLDPEEAMRALESRPSDA